MTKVAVGVRVKVDDDWATIMEVLPNGAFLVEWDEYGPGTIPCRESDFDFDQPDDPRAPLGPIRTETVTVRRLEPGVYGRLWVHTGEYQPKNVYISITNLNGVSQGGQLVSAPELRELARVALEIAEYLDAQ